MIPSGPDAFGRSPAPDAPGLSQGGTAGTDDQWHKLHPLTPVVRAGRVVIVLVAALGISQSQSQSGPSTGHGDPLWIYDVVLIAFTVAVGVVRWLVTRWRLDGPTLRIESGLIRRDSRQLPVARIQAVDVFRPFLARILGLAELRIRLAGSHAAGGRLAYLSEPVALDLRARLLAGHHGLDMATPEPEEHPVATVPTGRLAGSVALSSATLLTVVLIAAEVVVSAVSRAAAVAIGGTLLVYLVGLVRAVWTRVSEQYGFTVAYAPDGIRIRRGLLGTVSETIPVRRVQAVRKLQPLLWRPFGWCRLEVEIAGGSAGAGQGSRAGTVTKALLPVGTEDAARFLVQSVVGPGGPALSAPPRRAMAKAPFSYHFLSAGVDDALAVAVTGRVQKVTSWVPLHKVQSVRLVQGPAQRLAGLSSVHVDAAGRRVHAVFRDRDAAEAEALFDDIAARSRVARERTTTVPLPPAAVTAPVPAPGVVPAPGPGPVVLAPPPSPAVVTPPPVPAGWYRDPGGRHELRFWDGSGWSDHVSDAGRTAVDPLP